MVRLMLGLSVLILLLGGCDAFISIQMHSSSSSSSSSLSNVYTDSMTTESYTNNWIITNTMGNYYVSNTGTNLKMFAANDAGGAGALLYYKQAFTGSYQDFSISLYHSGNGRNDIFIGPYPFYYHTRQVDFWIDTDDVPQVSYSSLSNQNWLFEFREANTPYLNTWITVRLVISNTMAYYYMNGVLKTNYDLGQKYLTNVFGFTCGSINWKSGNNTSYYKDFKAVTMD